MIGKFRSFKWRKVLLLVALVYGIVLLVNHSYVGHGATTTTAGVQHGGDGHMYPRKATKHSPFRIVFEKRQSPQDKKKWVKQYRRNGYDEESAAEEQQFLEDWDSASPRRKRLARCRLLVGSMYQDNMEWSNEDAFVEYTDEKKGSEESTLLLERMRIYNYCFLKGDLNALDVFNTVYFKKNGLTAWDFQWRMFPFLDREFDVKREVFWPELIDLHSKNAPALIQLAINEGRSKEDFNSNFMQNWLKESKGRGIVVTTGLNQLLLFAKQLQVLDELGNTLPIQIVTTGKEADSLFLEFAVQSVKDSKQEVYLMDVSRLLSQKYADEKIDGFMYKWLAVLFSGYNEELLLDVDVVPFENPREYFSIEKYQENGIYFYRDRAIEMVDHKYQLELKFEGDPSAEEKALLGTTLMFESNFSNKQALTTEGQVYQFFFNETAHHIAESGLVPINRQKKFGGLLMGFLMSFDARYSRVSYGDKELFWLGQLYSGYTYSMSNIKAASIGRLQIEYTVTGNPERYIICSTQIAHLNEHQKLSWINGGLRNCVYEQLGEFEFEMEPEYFQNRYHDVETLNSYYEQPVSFEAAIIPEGENWLGMLECANKMICAAGPPVDEHKLGIEDATTGNGLVVFDKKDVKRFQKIIKIWYDKGVYINAE